jgi:glycerophosphoryl diester phosphodiesterase
MKKIILTLFATISSIALFAQPKVVGHRGCRDVEGQFENTVSSLKYAQQVGVDAVEFDVQLTSDNKIIVFHGPYLPGDNTKSIHDMTFEQARAYKLPYGLQMPTLEEYFKQAKKYPQIPVILEFKKQSTEQRNRTMVQQAVDIARKMNMGKQLEYTTFSETVCRMIREIEPDAKIIYLGAGVHVKDAAYAKEKGYDGISYDLNAWLNHPEIAAQAKQLGIETTLWLSNDYEVIDWAILHDIDYVSTDFPAQAVKYVKSVKEYR